MPWNLSCVKRPNSCGDCYTLSVEKTLVSPQEYRFCALPQPGEICTFAYQGLTYQVALGFEVDSQYLQTYDKGINPITGQAIWGALLGPYRFQKLSLL